MEKLTDEKKDIIFKRLCSGCTCKVIAEELSLTLRTVQRYKKILKPALDARKQSVTTDDDMPEDYKSILTKTEQKLVSKIAKELDLYDDAEEGWVFHLSKGDLRVRHSGCWWSAIVYPDSAPDDWIEKLRAQGFRIAISPLHDKDVWMHDSPQKVNPETGEIIPKGAVYKMGDKKKAHWHVIVVVDKRCSFVEINSIMQKICRCPYIQKCRSLRNAYDYFLHINAPEKCQTYRKEDIQTFNNFHVEPNKYEINLLSIEICNLIQEHNLNEWASVVEFFMNDPELSMVLSSRTAYFSSYVKSRYYRMHPNNVKYIETKSVKQFSFEDENDNESE